MDRLKGLFKKKGNKYKGIKYEEVKNPPTKEELIISLYSAVFSFGSGDDKLDKATFDEIEKICQDLTQDGATSFGAESAAAAPKISIDTIIEGQRGSILSCAVAMHKEGDDKMGVVQLLLQHGADINCESKESKSTPIKIAIQGGDADMLLLLLKENQKNPKMGNELLSEALRVAMREDDLVFRSEDLDVIAKSKSGVKLIAAGQDLLPNMKLFLQQIIAARPNVEEKRFISEAKFSEDAAVQKKVAEYLDKLPKLELKPQPIVHQPDGGAAKAKDVSLAGHSV